jgi:hypothetical protein
VNKITFLKIGCENMIKNKYGYIPVEQFIKEMEKRNLSIEDLILLYEIYENYNYMAKQTVSCHCSENKNI